MIVDSTQNWMFNMWVKIERGSHVLEEEKNSMMVEDYIVSIRCRQSIISLTLTNGIYVSRFQIICATI